MRPAIPRRISGLISAVTTGRSGVPEAFVVLMSAPPSKSPRSDGLMGDASTRTTTSSGFGSGIGTSTSESSRRPSFFTVERSCSPVRAVVVISDLRVGLAGAERPAVAPGPAAQRDGDGRAKATTRKGLVSGWPSRGPSLTIGDNPPYERGWEAPTHGPEADRAHPDAATREQPRHAHLPGRHGGHAPLLQRARRADPRHAVRRDRGDARERVDDALGAVRRQRRSARPGTTAADGRRPG